MLTCQNCGAPISQAFAQALDGTYAVVNTDNQGQWICPVTGDAHDPGEQE